MMGADKIFDRFRQIVFIRQFQSIRHMADNDLCTLFVIQILMRINPSRLILRKESRIFHLPDIVIQSPRTY